MTLPLMPPRLGVGNPVALPPPPGAEPIVPPPIAPPAAAPPPPAGLMPAAPQLAPPAMPPAPVPPPQPPPPPPPTITPDSVIKDRPAAKDITNPFTRQATLIVDTAEDWAKRMAANLGEHPSDTKEATPQEVHEMFHFSPYGTAAPEEFWKKHDALLAMATKAGDPDPYAVAERGALDEVYPHRATLALLDSLGPEQRVERAEMLLGVSHREIAKGNPHDALPSIVGPAGLPPPTQGGGDA